jgi:hypothetical protein
MLTQAFLDISETISSSVTSSPESLEDFVLPRSENYIRIYEKIDSWIYDIVKTLRDGAGTQHR